MEDAQSFTETLKLGAFPAAKGNKTVDAHVFGRDFRRLA
jgi:hypothetical protein